eukprot:scaffold29093_cov94-Skeletonema_dohrnii-CCMP3373.AAC.1
MDRKSMKHDGIEGMKHSIAQDDCVKAIQDSGLLMQQYDNTADIINVILILLFVVKSLLIITQPQGKKRLHDPPKQKYSYSSAPIAECGLCPSKGVPSWCSSNLLSTLLHYTVVSYSDDSSVFEIYTPTTLIIVT